MSFFYFCAQALKWTHGRSAAKVEWLPKCSPWASYVEKMCCCLLWGVGTVTGWESQRHCQHLPGIKAGRFQRHWNCQVPLEANGCVPSLWTPCKIQAPSLLGKGSLTFSCQLHLPHLFMMHGKVILHLPERADLPEHPSCQDEPLPWVMAVEASHPLDWKMFNEFHLKYILN